MGRNLTEEHRKNLSKALKGRVFSKGHCKRISQAKKGYKMKEVTKQRMSDFWKKKWQDKVWKEKIIKNRIGRKMNLSLKYRKILSERAKCMHTPEARKKRARSVKRWWDANPKMKIKMGELSSRRKLSPTHKNKLTFKGRIHTEETKRKIGLVHKGKIQSEATKEKLRQYVGEKASGWMGGLSFEPYTSEFNNLLRRKIRKRDGNLCFLCHIPQSKLKRLLSVHHIDYDKTNNDEDNLITLCNKCHVLTNKKRDIWPTAFSQLMGEYYGN